MAKRSSIIFTLPVMLLMFLSIYGCGTGDNSTASPTPSTSSSQTALNENTPMDTTTTIPHDNELYFEELLSSQNVSVLDIPTQIHIMISNDSPLPHPIDNFWEYKQEILDTVDFSHYFLLLTFMGFQSLTGPAIEVTQIWQLDNIIWVEALFDKGGPTYQPAWSSPYDIVKVSKDNMTQFGEITFILLDQNGEERARAVCEIPE